MTNNHKEEVMEENIYARKTHNSWKVIGIVFIVLAVVAVSVATFFGLKYFDMQNDINNRNNEIDTLTAQVADLQSQIANQKKTGTETETKTNKNYLVIEEWGVKAAIPEGLTDVYYQVDGDYAYIVARPATDASPFVLDVANNVKQYSLVALTRSEDSDSHASAGTLASSVKIGNYYFFVSGAQAYMGLFGNTDADHEMETNVQTMLVDMLKNIEAK